MSENPNSYRNLVGGRWIEGSTGSTYENEDPTHRGSSLGRFQSSSPADVVGAIDAASSAFLEWRQVKLEERQELVGKFLSILQDSKEELARVVVQENGKTIREARAEVASALAEGIYHNHQASRLLGHTTPIGRSGVTGWTQYQPLGVAGIISPWNFPVNVLCRKVLPAILTGNTVVMKPASFTPWSGIYLSELFGKAGFPPGVFNCVTGAGSKLGDVIIGDPRVRAISFTGSTEVGKEIQQKAAAQLKRTQLELGGKNAVIVMDDADLDVAVDAVIAAGFACAGQWCTSTSRIMVHEAVYSAFSDRLAGSCNSRVLGDPMDESTEMGPVAGPSQFDRIAAAIDKGEAQGARKIAGGVDRESEGYFIRPTLFADVTPSMELFQNEIFGPVLAMTPFHDLHEALSLANESQYALSSSIFTRNLESAFTYINQIQAGLAHVNIHTGYKEPSLPFGGWKESGSGMPENDQTGLEFFLDRKAVYVKTE